MPFIPATLLVSAIWFLWHLPLWLVSSSNQSGYDLLPYALQLTVNAFALAALYKVTKSTAACVLYHAWGNAIGILYKWEMFATYPIHPLLLLYDGAVILVSILLSLRHAKMDVTR